MQTLQSLGQWGTEQGGDTLGMRSQLHRQLQQLLSSPQAPRICPGRQDQQRWEAGDLPAACTSLYLPLAFLGQASTASCPLTLGGSATLHLHPHILPELPPSLPSLPPQMLG